MKDIIIKHKITFALIAILLVFLIIIRLGNKIAPTIIPSATTTPASTNSTTTTGATGSKASTTVTSATTVPVPSTPSKPIATSAGLKMTTSKELNYDLYMTQLGDNKRKCEIYAENLYNKTYAGTLESVIYSGTYNEDAGQCFLEVTGQKTFRDAFGQPATTTQNFYFRNAITTTLLAECVRQGTSVQVNENQYTCTDKVTGKTILKSQYDNLLASYK